MLIKAKEFISGFNLIKTELFKKVVLGAFVVLLAGCAAEIGSDEWCEDMKEKPKGDWTANEAKDFAKHCLLK